jgi:hypothetical protein
MTRMWEEGTCRFTENHHCHVYAIGRARSRRGRRRRLVSRHDGRARRRVMDVLCFNANS